MMRLKKLLLVMVMLFAPLSVGAQGRLSVETQGGCYSFFTELAAPYGGTLQLYCNNCQTHLREFEVHAIVTCQATYQNYSVIPGLVANGRFSLEADMFIDFVDFLGVQTGKITFDGGPVHFSYRNENYEVFFNEMFFNFNFDYSYFEYTITDVGGGLTVNGQYVPATPELFELLLSL